MLTILTSRLYDWDKMLELFPPHCDKCLAKENDLNWSQIVKEAMCRNVLSCFFVAKCRKYGCTHTVYYCVWICSYMVNINIFSDNILMEISIFWTYVQGWKLRITGHTVWVFCSHNYPRNVTLWGLVENK